MNEFAHAFIATDTEGIITHWSKAAEQLLSWEREKACGCDFFSLISASVNLSQFLSKNKDVIRLTAGQSRLKGLENRN